MKSARETVGDEIVPAGVLPEVRMIGYDRFKTATVASLAPHRHPDAYEVCCLLGGQVDWWAAQETHRVRRGDFFVTRPGEWHGGAHSVMQPCELFWVQVIAAGLPDDLSHGLCRLPRRVFPGTATAPAFFAALLAEHREAFPLHATAARAALHSLLVALLRDAEKPPTLSSHSAPVAEALRRLGANLDAPLSVEQVAQEIRLSVPRLVERFLQEVGETPGEWRTRRRLQAARVALREPGATVTQTAFAHGFASSQYFATAFKRHFGLSPSEWRDGVP